MNSMEVDGNKPIIEPFCYSLITPSKIPYLGRGNEAQVRDPKTLQRTRNPMIQSRIRSHGTKNRINRRNEITKNYNTTFSILNNFNEHLMYGKTKQNALKDEIESMKEVSELVTACTPKDTRSLRNAQKFFNSSKGTIHSNKQQINKLNEDIQGKDHNMKSLDLNDTIKKQIIFTMLKENKIPTEIIAGEEKYLRNVKDQQLRLEKLSEAILASYDVIVQTKESSYKSGMPDITHKRAVTREKIKRSVIVNKSFTNKMSYNTPSFTLPQSIAKQKKIMKEEVVLPEGVIDCVINRKIALINRYTALLYRNKEPYLNLKAINWIHKKLGLGKLIQNEEELKSRERICQIKESLLRLLYSTINKENMYVADNNVAAPRYFVGGGNNSPLVKLLLRERCWWIQGEDRQKSLNLLWTQWRRMDFILTLGTTNEPLNEATPRISNHLEGNCYLGYKKNIYKCLSLYYSLIGKEVSDIVPLTFHIKGRKDPEYEVFKNLFTENETKLKAAGMLNSEDEDASETELEDYTDYEASTDCGGRNLWIIKPGENTNRGHGIIVSNNLYKIVEHMIGLSHTYIIQKYIERPFLFEKRKFDIRCFALITSINGYIKAYYYQEGYLRTSSKDYSVRDLSRSVHLTNEAVQIHNQDFGKHEAGNKVSYNDFNKYLHSYCQENDLEKIDFFKDILPKIKVRFC